MYCITRHLTPINLFVLWDFEFIGSCITLYPGGKYLTIFERNLRSTWHWLDHFYKVEGGP